VCSKLITMQSANVMQVLLEKTARERVVLMIAIATESVLMRNVYAKKDIKALYVSNWNAIKIAATEASVEKESVSAKKVLWEK